VKRREFTNATTGALVNANTLKIDGEIINRLGLPESFIAELSMPGETVGRLTPEVRAEVGGDLEVVLCATHDTGSAVEAIPMVTDSPYISSGTWSLLGVKTPTPLTDEKSRESGYSNEGGVGYNRYQINITGMWIIQCLRAELCPDKSFVDIAKMAATSKFESIFNVNDGAFLAPKSMKDAISSYFTERGKARRLLHDSGGKNGAFQLGNSINKMTRRFVHVTLHVFHGGNRGTGQTSKVYHDRPQLLLLLFRQGELVRRQSHGRQAGQEARLPRCFRCWWTL
jgi:sugar (pentulose or hexulose) kinase